MSKRGVDATAVVECPGVSAGQVVERVVAVVAADGRYRTVQVAADRLQFARTYRPTWSLVLGVLLVPVVIGIPLLLHRVVETCTVLVEADHRGTVLRLSGRLAPELLATLRDDAGTRPPTDTPAAVGAPVASAGLVPSTPKFVLSPNAEGAAEGTADAPAGASTSLPLLTPGIPDAGSGVVSATPGAAVPTADATLRPSRPAVPVAPAGTGPASAPVHPVVVLDDGTRVAVTGRVHIGRDPEPVGAQGPVSLVPVADPDRSLSKTHLGLHFDGARFFVADLGSTNGSALLDADGTERPLVPGEWSQVDEGARLRMGRRLLVVERSS